MLSTTLTSLGASHQVSLGLNDGDSMLLDRGGTSVATQGDITHDDLPHVYIMELQNDWTNQYKINCSINPFKILL